VKTEFNSEQNDAALQVATQALKEVQLAEQQTSTALVAPRPRGENGRYLSKKKKSKAQKSTESIQRVMTEKNEEGLTREERLVAHLVDTAMTAEAKDLMSAAKVYEVTSARAWGKVRESEESLAALERQAVKVVMLSPLDLMNPAPVRIEDLQRAAPRQPSFAQPSFIEGEVVSTNPPAPPVPEPVKKSAVKPVECRCDQDSPMYCPPHSPSVLNSRRAE
jgi:hypothetical protein